MVLEIQYMLNNNPYLKKYLRENSFYYKNIIRNPQYIYELNNIMKDSYKINLKGKLEKIKNDISILNTVMDVLN